MKKGVSIFFVALVFVILTTLCVNSVDKEEIIKTAEFITSSKDNPSYDKFDKQIKEDGDDYELIKTKYKFLDAIVKTSKHNRTTEIVKSNLTSKSYTLDENTSYYHKKIKVNNKEYQGTLAKVEYDDHTKTNRYGEVSKTKSYGLRTNKPNPPSSMVLEYYDNDTGQTISVDAPLVSLKTTQEKWQDYTYIDIVVSNYTDTQFMFNNKIVTHDENSVLPSTYYDELLSMAGLSGDNYKVSNIIWSGSVYTNGKMKYRNARAKIQAYSCAYTADYYKKFNLDDIPVYTAHLTYKYSEEMIVKTEYKYQVTAVYRKIKNENTNEPTTQQHTEPLKNEKNKQVVKALTTVSVLLVISLIFVLLFMLLLTKIKSKKQKQ